MRLSLNEVEVTVRKAALGVGLPLGLAEDAGAAAAWLAATGFPVVELIGAALETTSAEPRMERGDGIIRFLSEEGACSVLRAGPSACDLALAAAGLGAGTAVEAVMDVPVLAVAQAVLASAGSGVALTIAAAGKPAAEVADGAPAFLIEPSALAALRAERVRIAPAKAPGRHPPQSFRAEREAALGEGVSVDAGGWRRVQDLADRMLVPATAHSHERGAGAGLIDSD
jgi:hypothetical protein